MSLASLKCQWNHKIELSLVQTGQKGVENRKLEVNFAPPWTHGTVVQKLGVQGFANAPFWFAENTSKIQKN